MNFVTFELVIHEFTFRIMKNEHLYVELIYGAPLWSSSVATQTCPVIQNIKKH